MQSVLSLVASFRAVADIVYRVCSYTDERAQKVYEAYPSVFLLYEIPGIRAQLVTRKEPPMESWATYLMSK